MGAVISVSKTVYDREWGCPLGGEDTVLITGDRNPDFDDPQMSVWMNIAKFQDSALKVLTAVSKRLKQSTSQITFEETDFCYIKNS